MSDSGVALVPTTTFADFDGELDVVMVPGGFGTNDAMRDAEIVDFLARTGPKARYVHIRLLRVVDPRHGRAARRSSRGDPLGFV